jgi:hypothetical protein
VIVSATQRRASFAAVLIVFAALMPRGTFAQYSYDPSAADELGRPGNLYFGAAKEIRGGYVAGVTIVLETDQTNFVLITTAQGRFRAKLPLDTLPQNVKPSCSKPGYLVLRVSKRLPPGRGKSPVQVDCLLRRQLPP